GAPVVQLGCRGGGGGVHHRSHLVLGDQAGEVGGRAQRATVDLGQREVGVVAGDDDVAVAGETDAAAHTEAVDGGDDRDGTVVHGGERSEAAPVGADQGVEPVGVLHLLDVDAGVEALPLGAQD